MAARRPHHIRALLLILSLLCLVGCALPTLGQPAPTPTPDPQVLAIQRLPVFALRYPASTLLGTGYLPAKHTLMGSHGAKVDKVFGVRAPLAPAVTPQAILAWYDARLRAEGWIPYPVGTASVYQIEGDWRLSTYLLTFGVFTSQVIRENGRIDQRQYPLVFILTVIDVYARFYPTPTPTIAPTVSY